MQKPYTEKQKAKNKICIQPSVTNFPRVDLNRKKEQNKQPMPISPDGASLLSQWMESPPFSKIPHLSLLNDRVDDKMNSENLGAIEMELLMFEMVHVKMGEIDVVWLVGLREKLNRPMEF